MQAEMIRVGPWQQAVRVKRALCSDGARRTVRLASEPDTFFTIPGRVTVRGRTVTGFISATGEDNEDYKFTANAFGKNGELLP